MINKELNQIYQVAGNITSSHQEAVAGLLVVQKVLILEVPTIMLRIRN